jgi:5'-3' exonuclease
MNTIHFVDAPIYVFRAYYSMPTNFFDQADNLVHAVLGYTSFLLDLRERGITHGAVAFDESLNTCYRNDIYPAYKANREQPDENIMYQFKRCQELTRLLGFCSIVRQDYEADDIIGSLAKQFGSASDVVIVSRDKDLGQLLRSNDLLWDFANDDYMGPVDIEQKFGVAPEFIADYLALAGDSVDNIPGAPGIGAKTAAALIQEFGSLDHLLNNPEQVLNSKIRGAKRLAKVLEDNRQDIEIYRRITEIYCDMDLGVSEKDLTIGAVDPAIRDLASELNLPARTIKRIEKLMS